VRLLRTISALGFRRVEPLPVNAPAPDAADGNRIVFKPSPLKGRAPAPASSAPQHPPVGAAEVTAVPLADPRQTASAHRDDHTMISFEPLAADPAALPPAGVTPGAIPRRRSRAWLYAAAALIAAALILLLLSWGGEALR
jgi:hypothetical protein